MNLVESRLAETRGRALVMDDEPVAAVLYGPPGPGPSPAGAFDECQGPLERVAAACDVKAAVAEMVRLVESGVPLPLWVGHCLLSRLRGLIPEVPRPILSPAAVAAGPVLRAVHGLARRCGDRELEAAAGSKLQRWHEGCDDYAAASEALRELLELARKAGDPRQIASACNNYGYGLLLEGRWKEAIRWLERALALYEIHGTANARANVRANLLTCRYELPPTERRAELLPEIRQVNRELCAASDWRARKTLVLLARSAAERCRPAAAIGWARWAVRVADEIPTQHRTEDRNLLEGLIESFRSGS